MATVEERPAAAAMAVAAMAVAASARCIQTRRLYRTPRTYSLGHIGVFGAGAISSVDADEVARCARLARGFACGLVQVRRAVVIDVGARWKSNPQNPPCPLAPSRTQPMQAAARGAAGREAAA